MVLTFLRRISPNVNFEKYAKIDRFCTNVNSVDRANKSCLRHSSFPKAKVPGNVKNM